MKNVSRVEKIVGPSPQISSAFTVLFLRLLLSTLVAITLICERSKNSRGGTPLKTEPRAQNGQGKEVWNRVASWEKSPEGHNYLELKFPLGDEGTMSNFLALPNQKSCLLSELKPLTKVPLNPPHRSRHPPNRYRGVEWGFQFSS